MANSTLINETVYSKLKEKFGEAISESQEPFDLLTVEVSLAEIHNVIEWLKNEPSFQINYLTLIGGIHYPENAGSELGVTYHLHSLIHNFRIRLKTFFQLKILKFHLLLICMLELTGWREKLLISMELFFLVTLI